MGTNKEAKDAEKARQRYASLSEGSLSTVAGAIGDIKPTDEAAAVNKGAIEDYNTVRRGDVANTPFVAQYKQQAGLARQRAEHTTPTGDASLASRVANPTLIAMNRDSLNRQAEQQQASDVTGIAAGTEQQAVNRIMGYNQASMGGAAQRVQGGLGVASMYTGMANNAYQRYVAEKARGTFWSNLGKGVLNVGGALLGAPGVGSAIFGSGPPSSVNTSNGYGMSGTAEDPTGFGVNGGYYVGGYYAGE